MKISDLVRNEIFRKISDETPEKIERIDEEVWQPFYKSFEDRGQNSFERFLFPYGLVHDPNLRKSEVFIKLRSQWNDIEKPAIIIAALDRFKAPYLDTIFGTNESGFPPVLADRFQSLATLGAPSSILPFTMQLGRAVLDEHVSPSSAGDILRVIESFLVRRAICGYEPTGLHAVFKRLWPDLGSDISPVMVTNAISSHKTVTWPDDEEVRRSIISRPLYGSAITPYLLLQYDSSLGGDAHASIETIEHVLPQSADASWKQIYGDKNFESDVNALPNLVPCTGKMNSSLGNQPYTIKKDRFAADSKFKSTREFSHRHSEWNADAFKVRATEMTEWATARWPHTRSATLS